jgi:hypothetical protein
MTPRDVVVEDAPDYLRLGLVDLQVGGALGGPKHSAIAIGDPPSEYLARTRSPQLSSPVTLGYLRPFVFGDHPLHLGQQFRLRVVIDDRRVDTPDSGVTELLDSSNVPLQFCGCCVAGVAPAARPARLNLIVENGLVVQARCRSPRLNHEL